MDTSPFNELRACKVLLLADRDEVPWMLSSRGESERLEGSGSRATVKSGLWSDKVDHNPDFAVSPGR